MRTITFIFLWLLVLAVPLENMIIFPGLGTVSRIIGGIAFVFAILAVTFEARGRPLGRFQILFVFLYGGAPPPTFGAFILKQVLFA